LQDSIDRALQTAWLDRKNRFFAISPERNGAFGANGWIKKYSKLPNSNHGQKSQTIA